MLHDHTQDDRGEQGNAGKQAHGASTRAPVAEAYEPSRDKTARTVRSKIVTSSHRDQFSM